MWKLALSRFKSLRALHKALVDESERADRLEIQLRRHHTSINELSQEVMHLSDRITALQGRLLGGGKGRPRKGASDLNEIAHGDKQALRAYFLKHPPKDDTEH